MSPIVCLFGVGAEGESMVVVAVNAACRSRSAPAENEPVAKYR